MIMEFTLNVFSCDINEIYPEFIKLTQSNPNKEKLISILNKRAVIGVPIISTFNSNGITCDFSSGLDTSESDCLNEFFNCFFPPENKLLNEITQSNVNPIVESIKTNLTQFNKMFSHDSYDIIELMFALEQVNTKHHNLFKCLEFCLILSKLELMENAIKKFYGLDIVIKTIQLNHKSVSTFSELYHFIVELIRNKFTLLNSQAPSSTWARMQLNSHKEVWALMWQVYSYEFKYLYDIESKYQINENKMEELFCKLCGYYTEIDENGNTIEKFSNAENMEKFNTFSQICQTAKETFRTAVNESCKTNLSKQDYESISYQVIEQIVSVLKEPESSNAQKYLPNILGTEIDIELLLNATTNTLNTFINYFENQLPN